ncbi:hypothetical protein [Thalassovita sp.]|uniref:hypothetical protein n=1 Tax=Thalassovita sp. TaxID=1979401 RepID=UPI0029DE628C|nr:hypothetical protein [Thalassovita sp.]
MSNPVTNADIEDVLSSIRRLVSEEARPQSAPKPAVANDRLVLTPALRVMETDRPEEVPSGSAPLETVEADTDQPQELPRPELVEGHELSGLKVDGTGRRNLEARIAELEAVIADRGGQWEQDGEEGSDNAGGPVSGLAWDAEPSFAHQSVELPVDELEFEPAEPAEIETVTEVEDRFEPDDYEPEALTEDEADPAEDGPEDDPLATDIVVDEEMLRNLVAEIVRQELQGPLGERITRNVRKLVRREIHRALTSQELE